MGRSEQVTLRNRSNPVSYTNVVSVGAQAGSPHLDTYLAPKLLPSRGNRSSHEQAIASLRLQLFLQASNQ